METIAIQHPAHLVNTDSDKNDTASSSSGKTDSDKNKTQIHYYKTIRNLKIANKNNNFFIF